MRRFRTICGMCALLGMLHLSVSARSQPGDPGPQAPSGGAPSEEKTLTPAELDALVAPIALYPDPLLANVLMAATYPLEVVRAERWLNENKKLQGDALKAAAEKQNWDESVKALVATPEVLPMMSEHLDWTQQLGEAFLAQPQDVMDAVQRLRAKAYERKKLMSTNEQVVTVKEEQNRQVIYIEPASADTIYVPYYEPAVVYGDWPYADYPPYPYYWGAPGYIAAGVLATGIAFGAAYAVGRWATGGYWGGNRINWGGGAIDINRGARVEHWQHNPQHRQGARYNNANLQQRFGNTNPRAGGNRQGLGSAASRPGAGDRGRTADRGRAGGPVADRGRTNRQAGAGISGGNRHARNRSAASRNVRPGRSAGLAAHRGASLSRGAHFGAAGGIRGGGAARFAGGGHRAAFHGGGGFRGGGGFGGGGGGARGGGRRSDMRLKHDVVLLGRLDNGLGFYRFAYIGSEKPYVGVIAQEVRALRPDAVVSGRDGYLRVAYERLGLHLQTYGEWIAGGGRIPNTVGRTQ